jgi:signal transduction histidine kinase
MASEVRSFAHNLSPALLQKKGVVEAIRHQVNYINTSKKLHIQFEPIGAMQKTSFRYELLIYNIIQELLQNIIKHAEATEAIIQLLIEDNLVSIFVEDNGKGCDPEKIKDGLGYTQIKQLVTFVRGQMHIDIAEHRGCRVSIEFTLLPDERQHSHYYS